MEKLLDDPELPESVTAFAFAIADADNAAISSHPDWAPTSSIPRLKHKRTSDANSGFSYHVIRWPMLLVISLWVSSLLVVYSCVRLWVSINEKLWVWRGQRKSLQVSLQDAKSYDEWLLHARKLDRYLNLDSWRQLPKSSLYNYRAVGRATSRLRRIEADIFANKNRGSKSIENVSESTEQLAVLLEACIRFNYGNIHSQGVYSQTYSGTKYIIGEFNDLLVQGVDLVYNSKLAFETKRVLFESFTKQLGKSALCLSGGGSLAYRHFGVIKALLDQDLLPRIVAGTSGGGLVAALICTRSDEELKKLVNPALADHLTACYEGFPAWFIRWWKTGARFDSIDWAVKARWWTDGDTTFLEAYRRTGKILNISIVPAEASSPTVLCNYVTTPNCLIWSALLASAAVPGILNPVVLLEKDSKGAFASHSMGSRWRDGSLRTDIPVRALNTFFNVNFPIVSQVNPHIHLFAFLPRGQVGRPITHKYSSSRWRGGFVSSAIEISVKMEIKKCVKLCQSLSLIPQFLDQDWSSVFLQKFTGAVTIWPKAQLKDILNILSDPNREQLKVYIEQGENAIFPKLEMIRHFISLERAIERDMERLDSRPDPEPVIAKVLNSSD